MNTIPPQPVLPQMGVVTIHMTGDGQFVVAGDQTVLRKYYETDPELWLRSLALKKEDENG